jgi:Xaa-Pro aminopeptidase
VLVAADSAAVFVDGRYTVQVRQQVCEDHYEIHSLQEGAQLDWLRSKLSEGGKVGFDPRLHNLNFVKNTTRELNACGLELVAVTENPIDQCWVDNRPQAVIHSALLLDDSYTGKNSLAKRREIGSVVADKGADAALIFAPDSVAWLLNIRGRDIPSLPMVLGHALLEASGEVILFANPAKIPKGFAAHVGEGVTVLAESKLGDVLGKQGGRKVLVDPNTANAWCQLALQTAGAELVAAQDPVIMPKACKNAVEVEGMRQAHLRDGVAEVRFLAWLDREVEQGRLHSEAVLADRLFEFRAEQTDFQEVSFSTISAAGSNAAMCHYSHLNGEPAMLEMDTVYLVDSGGQYLDGTTDITRTVAIGDPGPEIRKMFTLVLQGHIALDQAKFPKGTTGTQLDILARQFLWREGFDYDHGTGHGVGTFLSVHEGPQRIGKAHNSAELSPGMVISNEPGFYKAGAYGIRCENLVVVNSVVNTEIEHSPQQPEMMSFEVITLAPFDLRLVDDSILTENDRQWLNRYHRRVNEAIGPHLNAEDMAWLEQATRKI